MIFDLPDKVLKGSETETPKSSPYTCTCVHMKFVELVILIDELVILLIEIVRDLTQSYDKRPYTHRKIQKATWQHKNATKNFDYTTIADRLRNISYPTGVVKPVYERSTFPVTTTAV